jgi:hypothetical protein
MLLADPAQIRHGQIRHGLRPLFRTGFVPYQFDVVHNELPSALSKMVMLALL